MNGDFILDTNAVVALLNGQTNLTNLLVQANWIGISIITELEFLSFPNLTANDQALFQQFKNRVEVINLDTTDTALLQEIVAIRRAYKVKLPDAIIAACTVQRGATLITNDFGFTKISNLLLQGF